MKYLPPSHLIIYHLYHHVIISSTISSCHLPSHQQQYIGCLPSEMVTWSTCVFYVRNTRFGWSTISPIYHFIYHLFSSHLSIYHLPFTISSYNQPSRHLQYLLYHLTYHLNIFFSDGNSLEERDEMDDHQITILLDIGWEGDDMVRWWLIVRWKSVSQSTISPYLTTYHLIMIK